MTANIVFFLVFDSGARMTPARLLVQSLHFKRDRKQNRFPLLLCRARWVRRDHHSIIAKSLRDRGCSRFGAVRSRKNKRREKSRAGLREL
jgi:hypothetical protein